jgi:hypothetical protein
MDGSRFGMILVFNDSGINELMLKLNYTFFSHGFYTEFLTRFLLWILF